MQKVPLKRLCTIVSGTGFPDSYQGVSDESIPFYKVGSLSKINSENYLNQAENTISNDTAKALGATLIPPQSSLMAKIGAAVLLKRVAINAQESCIDNNMMAMIPKPNVHPKYLFYLLQTIQLEPLMNPGAVPNLNMESFRNTSVPYFPWEEQKRIADELDCELAEIDEFISDQLKLKGLLKEQFEAQKEKIILEAGGQKVRLSRVLKGIKDGTHGTHPRVDSGGEVLLSAKNISSGKLVISEDESRISLVEAAQITASGFPRKGDVMMILVGATYGRTALYNLDQTLPFQRSVGFFRPNEKLISSDYLKLVMSSREFQQQLSVGIKTSAQPGIYLSDVASCMINLPKQDSQLLAGKHYYSAEKIYDEIFAEIDKLIEHLVESRNSLILTSLYS